MPVLTSVNTAETLPPSLGDLEDSTATLWPLQLDLDHNPTMQTLGHLHVTPIEVEFAESITTHFEEEPAVRELTDELVKVEDIETLEHSHRVTLAALIIANRMHMDIAHLANLAQAGLVHDVGKADPLLQPLVRSNMGFGVQEREAMKMHPYISAERIAASSRWDDSQKLPLIEIVLAHHAFKTEGAYGVIPKEVNKAGSEVLALADTLDAIASKRSYKAAFDAKSGSIANVVQDELSIDAKFFRAAFNRRRAPQLQYSERYASLLAAALVTV